MDIRQTLAGLDGLFARKELAQVEPFLLEALAQAERENDQAARLTILNELVGYYRSISRTQDSLQRAVQALAAVAEMGLAGTAVCATTLINAATAYRAAGDLAHAALLYEDALAIFDKTGEGGYTLASLLNNMSQVYQTLGEHEKALPLLERALALLTPLDGADAEIATTHSNLALSLMALHQRSAAQAHINQALAIFEGGEGPRDAHYGAALAAAGELAYLGHDYAGAVDYFERALPEIEQSFGRNDGYETTVRNLETARRALAGER